jgi:hypothetical protein
MFDWNTSSGRIFLSTNVNHAQVVHNVYCDLQRFYQLTKSVNMIAGLHVALFLNKLNMLSRIAPTFQVSTDLMMIERIQICKKEVRNII